MFMRDFVDKVVVSDDGEIIIKIDDILTKENISRSRLATAMGVDYRVVRRLCKGETSRIDFHILKRLCYTLECDIQDIIEYIPPKENTGK